MPLKVSVFPSKMTGNVNFLRTLIFRKFKETPFIYLCHPLSLFIKLLFTKLCEKLTGGVNSILKSPH